MVGSSVDSLAKIVDAASFPILVPRQTAQAVGPSQGGSGQSAQGIGIVSFLSAIGVALAIFAAQITLFVLLRNKLARVFKPKTYLVPERERTAPPSRNTVAMIWSLVNYSDRDLINKCGLDAYFFLRYLKTLLVIFLPICAVVLPILIPLNYIDGQGQHVDVKDSERSNANITGLDTLAWQNVSKQHTSRYTAHLVMGILVVIWVCTVFFFELRVYIKVRQDYLTSAEHRLRASATTVLVTSIPKKWLSKDALAGLFDVFPGGVRNIWLNRDLTKLLDKISDRRGVHAKLESAETDLIKAAKRAQLKRRNAEEKKSRRKLKDAALTKEEKTARDAQEDAEAQRMANSGEGTDAGNTHSVPHTVRDSMRDSTAAAQDPPQENRRTGVFHSRSVINPLSKVGRGLRGVATKAGTEVHGTRGTAHGFSGAGPMVERRADAARACTFDERHASPLSPQADSSEARTTPRSSPASASSASDCAASAAKQRNGTRTPTGGNTVRPTHDADDMILPGRPSFWQFWKPPAGGYASPIPQGAAPEELKTKRAEGPQTPWQQIKSVIPFVGGDGEDEEEIEYPSARNPDHAGDKNGDDGAVWAKYLKKRDRPTHHLPLFGVGWLFGLPLISKKVDTIYWCRQELARLNLEIEEDQKHPERFPLIPSAFVQFNHQVAAHMACQSVVHHLPRQMFPRMNEISPRDIIWENMALNWWQEWVRSFIVVGTVIAMIFLWAIPVAWTAALGQLDKLIADASWLSYLRENKMVGSLVKIIAGILPAATLSLLLVLVPIILNLLAGFKGAKTGAQKSEFVQRFYFVFLFVQVFLIVSIASFFAASLTDLVGNIKKLQSLESVLDLLASNLPRAANYFFSYMILQALSTSSGTLLQIVALATWFILAPMFDSTARSKWTRNTTLAQISWGSFFPVYTNFACIGLVYCVISPLISVFAIITFSLLWLAQRYAMLYVNRFELDTGGVLYPRAINQTFTGLYFMELCMAGMFFLVEDTEEKRTCTTHGIIMIVVLMFTAIFQILLNVSFSPLFRNLPITFEDEAVLRDEAFQRAQDARFGLVGDQSSCGDYGEVFDGTVETPTRLPEDEMDDELGPLGPRRQGSQLREHVKQVGHWAKSGGGNQLRRLKEMTDHSRATQYRRQQRQKDLEAQRAIGDALYGGIHDDIEDLTPAERDVLTKHAFQHYALRARRPTVWIPRDDLGISEDEIRRTHNYSKHIWISNEGTALDSKVRVVYGQNPPDFSEVDIINL
ncbi:hypothetical protein DCS_00497 [Drechmeria coniospora]|uniref:DUF221 domain protein n=1 Tax=Drechmeria coniospora TaxID=98403 RepID=A0A151GQH8_DRECN|nr:hypothetical protein DCS_00497 [Drechmeria coniospora]KYK59367.1 hypothetical protein DCS_00497 [Drechmeria coniospora]ODA76388.1 hypothetical protein RJ55_08234 [Drechmeria coniospora]